jgi:hypothetical protein
VGIATNPGVALPKYICADICNNLAVIVATISSLFFVFLTLISSYITTFFLSSFQDTTTSYWYFGPTPIDVAQELVRAALGILQDEDEEFSGVLKGSRSNSFPSTSHHVDTSRQQPTNSPGFIKSFVTRFIIGLPLIGASSLVHMLLSLPFLNPLHYLARYRGNRRRNNNSRDIAALIIIFLLFVGAARYVLGACLSSIQIYDNLVTRALYKVYRFTESVTKRLLMRAEDAILEVA